MDLDDDLDGKEESEPLKVAPGWVLHQNSATLAKKSCGTQWVRCCCLQLLVDLDYNVDVMEGVEPEQIAYKDEQGLLADLRLIDVSSLMSLIGVRVLGPGRPLGI